MKKYKFLLLGLIVCSLSACMKDEFLISKSALIVRLDKSNLQGAYELSNIKVTLTESNSDVSSAIEIPQDRDSATTSVPYGNYTASLSGDITFTQEGSSKSIRVNAMTSGIVINSETTSVALELFLSDPSADFVFKEIFFTGTLTPEGKKYNGDKYFILHNNSMDTLYADGLFIAQSDFLTITKRIYTPDVMNDAFTSNEIIMVPGSGNEFPVLPGEDFVIANNAIDHTESNNLSFDLRQADLEIELIGSINVDNPDVVNAINISGNMLMHNQGYTAYVMGRLPQNQDVETFKVNNAYSYSYQISPTSTRSVDSYKIPNSLVIDAVNLSVKSGFEWIVTSPALDMGWSYAGKLKSDDERYGKAVIRKTLGELANGKPFLKDDNNSSEDFTAAVKASLMK